jgi:hypothetical protein
MAKYYTIPRILYLDFDRLVSLDENREWKLISGFVVRLRVFPKSKYQKQWNIEFNERHKQGVYLPKHKTCCETFPHIEDCS